MRSLICVLLASVCGFSSSSFAGAVILPSITTLDISASSALSDMSSDSSDCDPFRALTKAVAPDAAEYLATQGQNESNILKAVMITWRDAAKTNQAQEILALSDYELVEAILAESLK